MYYSDLIAFTGFSFADFQAFRTTVAAMTANTVKPQATNSHGETGALYSNRVSHTPAA